MSILGKGFMGFIYQGILDGDPIICRAFIKSLTDAEFHQLQEEMRGINDWGRMYLELLRITN